ncbi:hypothetical protein MASR1M12_00860 [Erysipelotrichia bacterium]
MATQAQIKIIHTLKTALRMTKEEYEAMLYGFGVESSKQLSDAAANEFENKLIEMGISAGVWRQRGQKSNKKRFDDLGSRPDMATPKQLRMIESIWREVSRADSDENRAVALRHFIEKYGVSDIRFANKSVASKIINALLTMKSTKWRQT